MTNPTTLEQSLRDLLVKHDLRTIRLEVATYRKVPNAMVFWDAPGTENNCDLAQGNGETFAEALSSAIEAANKARDGSVEVALPDAPLCIEVAKELPEGLRELPNGTFEFQCNSCEKWSEWPDAPETFVPGDHNNLCGGSPRCIP